MRVLESERTPRYTMGKNRKLKFRKTKDASESSDETTAQIPLCNHINMAVNVAAMRKGIGKNTWGVCGTCAKDISSRRPVSANNETSTGEDVVDEANIEGIEPTLWVCLQCGHQGCDRNSREKHALKHYEAPRSNMHCMVINTTFWSCWCYKCDDDVPVERSKRLQECIDILRKQAGLPQIDAVKKTPSTSLTVATTSGIDNKDAINRPSTPKSSPSAYCMKIKGLNNLGNTCFFNAVLQNLAQTQSFEAALLESKKTKPVNMIPVKHISDSEESSSDEEIELKALQPQNDLSDIQVTLAEPGPLTQSLVSFLQEMNNHSAGRGTVNPNLLFSQVCKKNQRFRGFQQQDSHELLRYLLDNMKTEEVKRNQTAILKFFKLSENTNPKKVDETTRAKLKEYGKSARHTFVDTVFGGHLISTVICEECKYVSQIFEPFLDLSLPVAEEKPSRPNQNSCSKRKESHELDDTTQPEVIEGFICKENKMSRAQERKEKRQAKKDAKRKAKLSKNQVFPLVSQNTEDDKDEHVDCDEDGEKSEDEVKKEDNVKEQTLEEDEQSSSRDDPSDADVEDNLESDVSRLMQSSLSQENGESCCQGNHCEPHSYASEGNGICSEAGETPTLQSPGLTSSSDTSNTVVHSLTDNASTLSDGSYHIKSGDVHNNISSNSNGSTQTSNVAEQFPENHSQTCVPLCSTELCMNGDVTVAMENLHISDEKTASEPVTATAKKVENHELANGITECSDAKQEEICNHNPADLKLRDTQYGGEPPSVGKKRKEWKEEAKFKSTLTLGHRYHPSSRECTVMSCLHQFTSAELLTGNNKFGCVNCRRLKRKQNSSKDKKETVYCNASKQYLIYNPPAILTLHMKRFEQVGYVSRKVNRHVDFPFVLDLAPFCSSLGQGLKPGQKRVLYSLYGVVEHSGRLNAGHYTAYVKVRPNIGISHEFLSLGFPRSHEVIQRYLENIEHEVTKTEREREESEEVMEEKLVPPGRWYHISDSRVSEATESSVQKAQAYLLFYERIY